MSSEFNSEPVETPDRASILTVSFVAFVIGAGLALGGYWLTEISPADALTASGQNISAGLLLSVPMCGLLAFCRYSPFQWSRRLWETPIRILGSGLTDLNALDVASVAIMAGVGEELLFRGFLQSWLTSYGLLWGLLIPNLLFGLLHAMTPAYAAPEQLRGGRVGTHTDVYALGVLFQGAKISMISLRGNGSLTVSVQTRIKAVDARFSRNLRSPPVLLRSSSNLSDRDDSLLFAIQESRYEASWIYSY